jgi:subtilisin family serine protease
MLGNRSKNLLRGLMPAAVAGASFVGGSTNDMHGHGTHVAGTACGSVYGVARSCIIHPVKVMSSGRARFTHSRGPVHLGSAGLPH